MKIQIVCKKPGFRRGGIAHPDVATYSESDLTKEQLAAFKAEPMLVVTMIPEAADLAKAAEEAAATDDAEAGKSAKAKKA